MAELIAVGASVIAIIQISDRIIGICRYYIGTARDAPSDFRAMILELSMLKAILENLELLMESGNGVADRMIKLSGEEGLIEGCRQSLTKLERLFPQDCVKDGSKRQKVKAGFAALAWPLKETKARKLLDEISRYKSTIALALSSDSMQDIKEIKLKTLEVHEILTDSQRQDIFRWLQHTDPSPLHHRAQKQYESGTGQWMLGCPEWAEWLDAQQRCLWVHGIPGAGKTVLMSYLIEQIKLHCDHSRRGKTAYVYYYCYFSRNQDEAIPFLRWVLCQLCRQADSVPSHVCKMYKRGGEPSLVKLLKAFADILNLFDSVYIIVDAIDESIPREDILRVIRDLVTDPRFEKVQLLASSREYIDVQRVIEQLSRPISMDNPFVKDDIRLRVRSLLHSNPNFERWPQELLDEVEETVSTGAHGMFRWAVCQVDVLQRLKCSRDIVQKALANLPKTLDETYDRIFLAIPEEERVFVHHTFEWIHYHNELYKGEGIPCAILLQAVAKSTADLIGSHSERYYDKEILRELCGCLIGITVDDTGDSTPKISFAHYTVREYLDSIRVMKASAAYFSAYHENLQQNCIKFVLLEALHVDENKVSGCRSVSDDGQDVGHALSTDFNSYCVPAAFISLQIWADGIFQQEDLYNLVLDLFDPSKPDHKLLGAAGRHMEDHIDSILMKHGCLVDFSFWDVEWNPLPSDPEAACLLNLLLFSVFSFTKGSLLLKKFLEGKDATELLQSPLHFRMPESLFDFAGSELHTFDGSIVEVSAHYACYGLQEFNLLLHYAAGWFDPSEILFRFIAGHDHEYCIKTECPLERLLGSGADPNIAKYQFTPLQIAAVCWDYEGVDILLRAGADPNYTGNRDGFIWQEDTVMARFNHLHNASPLHICKNFGRVRYSVIDKRPREEVVKMIQAALVEYGAVD